MPHPFLLALLLLSSAAQAAPKLIVFEALSPAGMQQSSLLWDDSTLTYVTNSNFTQSRPDRAILGLFTRVLTPELKKRLEATQKTKSAPAEARELEHGIRIEAGGQKLVSGTKQYQEIVELMRELSEGPWRAQDGIEIRLGGAQKSPEWKALAPLRHTPPKLDCRENGVELECTAAPYGRVRLQRAEGR